MRWCWRPPGLRTCGVGGRAAAAGLLGAEAVGYAATASPRIGDVVAAVAGRGRRVAVASWLLAPGVFHDLVSGCGADVVAAPVGAHPLIAEALVRRYYEGLGEVRRSA
ncbi:hypothetical protein [Lentzea guizhouensis]|uniref:hypothetical protein n=1 Tax=Lentzea guizhouensis TaxID=1586287 RepID=UPI001F4072E4|nr:hypothetical protein [Lentzea guizhouensis]